ncbi:MAG: hypothetical protein P8I55_13565 [Crocinitomix sp.]|nr:hypothetical protein [Crocinitomix sp.]
MIQFTGLTAILRCSFNSLKRHIIPPDETISLADFLSIHSNNNFSNTEFVRFSIPVGIDGPTIIRVSGFNPDQLELFYEGKLLVVTTYTSNTKRRNRKKIKPYI